MINRDVGCICSDLVRYTRCVEEIIGSTQVTMDKVPMPLKNRARCTRNDVAPYIGRDVGVHSSPFVMLTGQMYGNLIKWYEEEEDILVCVRNA